MKYKLTDETIQFRGRTLYRIKALEYFCDVKKGDKGGWVETEVNLSQKGDCWIYGDAKAMDKSRVEERAILRDFASMKDNAYMGCGSSAQAFASLSGNAKMIDSAVIGDSASMSDNTFMGGEATLRGNAKMSGFAYLVDSASMSDFASIDGGAGLSDNASIRDFASMGGKTFLSGNATLKGRKKLYTIPFYRGYLWEILMSFIIAFIWVGIFVTIMLIGLDWQDKRLAEKGLTLEERIK